MTRDRNGVALVGRILTRVAGGPCTAADLVAELGAARTTVFETLRALETAGFVDRDARGIVSPGQACAALGLARFGLGPIAGAAAALLSALRDDTDGRVELVVRTAGQDVVLAHRSPAGWNSSAAPEGGASAVLEAPIDAGRSGAVLRLRMRGRPSGSERDAVRCSLIAVAEALSRAGRRRPTPGGDP